MGSFVPQLPMVTKIRHNEIGHYVHFLALIYREKGVKIAIPDLPGSIPDLPHSIPDLIGAISDLLGSILDLKCTRSGMLPG